MASKRFVSVPRRRREGKTDYGRRVNLVLGRRPFASVHAGSKNILVQLSEPALGGDRIISSFHSRRLSKYGWKGAGKSIPAAYLCGLALGLSAPKDLREAVLYAGVMGFHPSSRVCAAVKGLVDAGLKVTIDPEVFPDETRIRGGHIAAHAGALKNSKGKYEEFFGGLLKRQFRPEDYPLHFEEVRERLLKEIGGGLREK